MADARASYESWLIKKENEKNQKKNTKGTPFCSATGLETAKKIQSKETSLEFKPNKSSFRAKL